MAKHLRCDELLYCTFIIQSAGKKILNWWTFGEVTGKTVVSCAPFALHFCPQPCWSRQINWIACVLQSETVTNRCCVNMQINVSHYQQISNCCRPDVGQSPTLARPAVALAHCIQQISCTSIATYRMLPKLISVDKNSSFMEKTTKISCHGNIQGSKI